MESSIQGIKSQARNWDYEKSGLKRQNRDVLLDGKERSFSKFTKEEDGDFQELVKKIFEG